MGFSAPIHRTNVYTQGAGNTGSITLAATPTAGNLVICHVEIQSAGITLSSAVDGNSNSYTVSTAFAGNFGNIYCAYLLKASNANTTVTFTFSAPVAGASVFSVEVPVSGGSATFNQFIGATSNVQFSVTTPTITPGQTGEFYYASVVVAANVTGVGGSWTSGGANDIHSNGDEYIVSGASGNTSINFTTNDVGPNDGVISAFIFTPTPSNPVYQDDSPTFSVVANPDSVVTVW